MLSQYQKTGEYCYRQKFIDTLVEFTKILFIILSKLALVVEKHSGTTLGNSHSINLTMNGINCFNLSLDKYQLVNVLDHAIPLSNPI